MILYNISYMLKELRKGFLIGDTCRRFLFGVVKMDTKERVGLLKESQEGYVVYWHHLSSHSDSSKEGYIGMTKSGGYGRRFSGSLKNRYTGCSHFMKAINKYGEFSIITEILYTGLSLKEANEIEKLLRPSFNTGWNIRQGGGNRGRLSEESKRKISKSKTGKNHLYYDRIFTKESREKIRQSKLGNKNMLGKKYSAEVRNNMSLSAKSRGIHPNTIKSRCKKVRCVETGEIFDSQVEAAVSIGLSNKHLSSCCCGRGQTAGGLHWEFV